MAVLLHQRHEEGVPNPNPNPKPRPTPKPEPEPEPKPKLNANPSPNPNQEHPVSRLHVPIQFQPMRSAAALAQTSAPATSAYYPQLSTELKRSRRSPAATNATLLLQPLKSAAEPAGKPLCPRQRRRQAEKERKRRSQLAAQTALLPTGQTALLAEALTSAPALGGEAAKLAANLAGNPPADAASPGYGGARDSTGGGAIPSEGVAPPSDNEPTSAECCEQTNAVLERYCHDQQPMGDLDLDHFDCAAEMGTQVSFVNEGGVTRRFTEVKS